LAAEPTFDFHASPAQTWRAPIAAARRQQLALVCGPLGAPLERHRSCTWQACLSLCATLAKRPKLAARRSPLDCRPLEGALLEPSLARRPPCCSPGQLAGRISPKRRSKNLANKKLANEKLAKEKPANKKLTNEKKPRPNER